MRISDASLATPCVIRTSKCIITKESLYVGFMVMSKRERRHYATVLWF